MIHRVLELDLLMKFIKIEFYTKTMTPMQEWVPWSYVSHSTLNGALFTEYKRLKHLHELSMDVTMETALSTMFIAVIPRQSIAYPVARPDVNPYPRVKDLKPCTNSNFHTLVRGMFVQVTTSG